MFSNPTRLLAIQVILAIVSTKAFAEQSASPSLASPIVIRSEPGDVPDIARPVIAPLKETVGKEESQDDSDEHVDSMNKIASHRSHYHYKTVHRVEKHVSNRHHRSAKSPEQEKSPRSMTVSVNDRSVFIPGYNPFVSLSHLNGGEVVDPNFVNMKNLPRDVSASDRISSADTENPRPLMSFDPVSAKSWTPLKTVQLLSGPSNASSVVGSLAVGNRIDLMGRVPRTDWYAVDYAGQPAYMEVADIPVASPAISVIRDQCVISDKPGQAN